MLTADNLCLKTAINKLKKILTEDQIDTFDALYIQARISAGISKTHSHEEVFGEFYRG